MQLAAARGLARPEPLQYPVPDRLIVAGLMNYVFEGDHALLVDARTCPASAEPGVAFPIDARLDYLVCTDEVCVPETATVTAELAHRRARRAPIRPSPAWRQALPRPLAGEGAVRDGAAAASASPSRCRPARRSRSLFLPGDDRRARPCGAAEHLAQRRHADRRDRGRAARRRAGRDRRRARASAPGAGLALTARPRRGAGGGDAGRRRGDGGRRGAAPGILLALLGALLGGLILNIMPCVFPILSLKALSLARAGETEAAARREALAYAAGVVLTCLALGGLLLALRAGGAAVGWAFQLQDPRVILLLLLLVTAIALNLAGLFRLPMLAGGDGAGAAQGGARGAFFTGALAAFVATPCTGPFMGAALGAALVLPAAGALAVFAGLGLGLALPFLAARLRAGAAPPAAEARAVDGDAAAHPLGADVPDRLGPRLDPRAGRPASTAWRSGLGRRAGARPRPVVARPGRALARLAR